MKLNMFVKCVQAFPCMFMYVYVCASLYDLPYKVCVCVRVCVNLYENVCVFCTKHTCVALLAWGQSVTQR